MAYFSARAEFEHGQPKKIGVLLCNLGTPEAPSTSAVRKYLAEFLADRRVVELSRWLWLPILHAIILRVRPRRSAHAYQQVWSDEGSPLLSISRRQVAGVQRRLDTAIAAPVVVELGMRYGRPSIGEALRLLREQNVRKLVVLPLYPQYAAATTGAVFDALATELSRWRWVPDVRFVSEYFDDPRYIAALAQSVSTHWREHGRGNHLLMSFHGIPEDYFRAGDPYHCRCHATARALATELELEDGDWTLSFQSRVGPKEWLKPYTDETVAAFGRNGMSKLDVVCPGFATDCLETIEEIGMQNDAFFKNAGGDRLDYIAALNDSDPHLDFIAELVKDNMSGWPELSAEWDAAVEQRRQDEARQRYLAASR